MRIEGSCHCGRVRFSVDCPHPHPYLRCYCSICRKTAGGGGYAINLGADNGTLQVTGSEHVSEYHPLMTDPDSGERAPAPGKRAFCRHCGSALWAWDPRWPELVHPHASAVDTALPVPPQHVHMMLGSKAPWVEVCSATGDSTFDAYPDESLAEWHRRLGR
ncbi:MAG: GFA family protein [Gammaproteobacteria bacterium]|nr:GFA family protein [Gammaproteobacteria bacterium]